MEGKPRNFLSYFIILVTVYTEAKILTNRNIDEELRALWRGVGHLRKAGKEQADIIKQLRSTIETQSVRIIILSETLQNQQNIIRKHENEIRKLKRVNSDLLVSLLKKTCKTKDATEECTKIKSEGKTNQSSGKQEENNHEKTSENRIGKVKIKDPKDVVMSKSKRERLNSRKPRTQNHDEEGGTQLTISGTLTRKYRLLSPVPTQPVLEKTVAFYAYMSADMNGIGSHHSLVFDVVKTNEGNGFHKNTGVFIPPKSGLYAFSWTLRVMDGAYHSVELVVSNDVVGSVYQTGSGGYAQGGATVVAFCNKGDDIYLRTRAEFNGGSITSNVNGRTSFTGWKI